ncbi:MAG: hypothetical protein EON56_05820 [Alphaproteobacteria bacterium]|nr:MAG: hypothetical protein EON56_05820 [Alphaproteobacteria bacterium]
MEEAVTNGILKAVAILGACYLLFMVGWAVLKFVDRYLGVFLVLGGTVAAATWAIKSQALGPSTVEYVIVGPLLGLIGVGVLCWACEAMVKIEAHWDRALEKRRYRKMVATLPWGRRLNGQGSTADLARDVI